MSLIQRNTKSTGLENFLSARFDESKSENYHGFANYYEGKIKPFLSDLAQKNATKKARYRNIDIIVGVIIFIIMVWVSFADKTFSKNNVINFVLFYAVFYFSYKLSKRRYKNAVNNHYGEVAILKEITLSTENLIKLVYEFDQNLKYRGWAENGEKEILIYQKFGIFSSYEDPVSVRKISTSSSAASFDIEYFNLDSLEVDVMKIKLPQDLGFCGVILGIDEENYLFNFDKSFAEKYQLKEFKIEGVDSLTEKLFFDKNPSDKLNLKDVISALKTLVRNLNASGFRASFLGDEILVAVHYSDALDEDWENGYFSYEEQEAFFENCQKSGLKPASENKPIEYKCVNMLPYDEPFDYIKESQMILDNLNSHRKAAEEISKAFVRN